jgi:ABC-type nitrate/sulfonate/bicarbonate transport system substrate-binding protein
MMQFRRVCLFLLCACLLGAPLRAAAAPVLEKPRITLAVGGQTTLYYLPLTIAERLGYFRDEGLTVEIQDFPGGAKALQALLGGSADVVSGAYDAFKRVRLTYSADGVISPGAVEQSYQVLLKHNAGVRRAPVLFLKDTYTNKFVQNALKKYN